MRFLSLIAIWTATASLAMAANTSALNQDELLITSLRLMDGTTLSEDFIIYPASTGPGKAPYYYFKVSDFCAAAGIQCQLEQSSVKGILFDDSRSFSIDCKDQKATYKKEPISLPADSCLTQTDGMYISLQSIQIIFPMRLTLESLRSEVLIQVQDPDLLFPAQMKGLRQQRITRTIAPEELPADDVQTSPSSVVDGVFIDARTTSEASGVRAKHRPRHQAESSQAFELLGFDAFQYLSYEKSSLPGEKFQLITKRQSLQKIDHYGRSMPFGIKTLKLLDTETPSVALVGSRRGRGIYLSNTGPYTPDGFDRQSFTGFLPQGWEVELYQNGVLISRRDSDGSGSYNFDDVFLFYGTNRFRLVFYGPQGQRIEEERTLLIDQDIARKGDLRYQLGAVREDLNGATSDEGSLRVDANLFRYAGISIGAVTSRTTIDRDDTEAQYLSSGIYGFLPGLFWRLDAALNADKGHAQQLSLKIPMERLTATVSAAKLHNGYYSQWFKADAAGLRQQILAMLAWSPGASLPIFTNLEFRRADFISGSHTDTVTHRLGTGVGAVYLTHEWQKEVSSKQPYVARVAANFFRAIHSLRGELGYSQGEAIDALAVSETRLSEQYSIGSSVKKNIRDNQVEMLVRMNALYQSVAIQAYGGWDTQKKEFIGLSCASSLGTYARGGNWFASSDPLTDGTSLTVRAFIDANNNGIYDEGESGLPGLRILYNGQRALNPSNDQGIAQIPRIPAYVPIAVEVDISSVEDPLLKPTKQTTWGEGRRGKPLLIDMPFQYTGEIDGYILQASDGKGLPGRKILLKHLSDSSVREVLSLSDGYYLIDSVRPGSYVLEVAKARDSETITPKSFEFTIPASGGIFTAPTVRVQDLED